MPAQKHHIRLLAAIMFADMVGYTRLMQEDERKAKLLRDRQRSVIDAQVIGHNGSVMQYYGDGMLCMFGSAIGAVNAGKEIQLLLNEEPKVPVRIGIHLGDVVYDDEGVYGDAVNIAARVQSLAAPGSVFFSGKVFEEIRNHPGLKAESFGEHELKNVFQKTGIFALANEGMVVPPRDRIQKQTGSMQNSIAVLPFVNFSRDKENEYFSDGITEEIINALANSNGLEIASRTSVFQYKNKDKDIRDIGKELNVSKIIEGSVRMAGERIRVTAQLINVKDGFHIWSENFDGELNDIFDLQDQVASKIASSLEVSLSAQNPDKTHEAPTESIIAYNQYLKGRYYWNKRTPESVKKAIECFKDAINSCSTYTNAYSSIANCYTYLAATGQIEATTAYPKAEKYAQKALELNSGRAESFTALGFVNLFFRYDFENAEANFRKAVTLEPDYAEARMGLAYYHRVMGEYEKMVLQDRAALKIDPLSLPFKQNLGSSLIVVNEFEEAQKVFDEILEMDPLFRSAQEGKALAYTKAGDYERAMDSMKKYLSNVIVPYAGAGQVGAVAALSGNKKKALDNLERLKKRAEEFPEHNLTLDFSILYASLGMKDEAFAQINAAIDQKIGAVVFVDSMFPFDSLKDDPRYDQILSKLGIKKQKQVFNET